MWKKTCAYDSNIPYDERPIIPNERCRCRYGKEWFKLHIEPKIGRIK